jgi:hypothetical protein
MVSWLTSKVLAYNLKQLNAGNPEPTLRLDADDVVLHFPGDSSWSGAVQGKASVRRWLERFVRVGFQIFADEVENRYVIWGRLAWGRLKEYEVYEDTQKAKALDEYLAVHEPALAAA